MGSLCCPCLKQDSHRYTEITTNQQFDTSTSNTSISSSGIINLNNKKKKEYHVAFQNEKLSNTPLIDRNKSINESKDNNNNNNNNKEVIIEEDKPLLEEYNTEKLLANIEPNNNQSKELIEVEKPLIKEDNREKISLDSIRIKEQNNQNNKPQVVKLILLDDEEIIENVNELKSTEKQYQQLNETNSTEEVKKDEQVDLSNNLKDDTNYINEENIKDINQTTILIEDNQNLSAESKINDNDNNDNNNDNNNNNNNNITVSSEEKKCLVCGKCKQNKTLDNFSKNQKKNKNKKTPICIQCNGSQI